VEHGRSGLLVPIGDAAAMAAAARSVLSDTALAGQLRSAGLQEAARYDWAAVRPLWLGAYERLARGVNPVGSAA
jgi:phosphatidylinositol alpha-mannosyltransferase